MPAEDPFVAEALEAAKAVLKYPLFVKRGEALLYEITVDNNLKLTVDPTKPVRGDLAFQTDLCVFEAKSDQVVIPRVVMEFKTRVTTHDVLVYSTKARRHKQVYPYLRYGFVASDNERVPTKFFVHNEALDFYAAVKDTPAEGLVDFFAKLLTAEVATSRRLESIAYGGLRPQLFRSEILTDGL